MTQGRRHSPRGVFLAIVLTAALAGCQAFDKHAERKIPQFGEIDPDQPRELSMVTMPTYVVEPPDILDIEIRPTGLFDPATRTLTVQPEGIIDLGFEGDVYVTGLTLLQIEVKIAERLAEIARQRGETPQEPIEVTARLSVESRSKYYYVMGTVGTEGKFPITGNDTVLEAILQAGLRSNSLPEKAYLARPHPHGGPDQILKIDWIGIKHRGDTLTNYQIFPGDRIVVPGGREPGLLKTLVGGP